MEHISPTNSPSFPSLPTKSSHRAYPPRDTLQATQASASAHPPIHPSLRSEGAHPPTTRTPWHTLPPPAQEGAEKKGARDGFKRRADKAGVELCAGDPFPTLDPGTICTYSPQKSTAALPSTHTVCNDLPRSLRSIRSAQYLPSHAHAEQSEKRREVKKAAASVGELRTR